ncbi:multicopy suppressor of BFA (Brefeldin A) [Malassezia sp. CBS 17886]|nr:multicopy suppressor of BFA (Brefeldin A) [Malassezia sp. CBS 17886]
MAETKTGDATPAGGVHIEKLPGGKPDAKHHSAELDKLKAELDKAHAKMNAVRAALSGDADADTPAGKRRAALRAELDGLRSQQAGHKGTRGKVFDEIKAAQDEIASRVKQLQASKSKAPFKSQGELDARIAEMEAQIESGAMKIVEERKALNEVSLLKKSRRTMEQLTAQQAQIDALRAQVDKLRGTLDDPESQALNRRYDDIKLELDALSREQEKVVGSRSKLLAQRTALSKTLDELYQARRDRLAAYHAEGDKYYAKVSAERERRQEQQRRERLQADHSRQEQDEEQLREEAALPAFAKEIEDCDVLIRYFSGERDAAGAPAAPAPVPAAGRAGDPSPMPPPAAPDGAIVARRKDEDDSYFVASGGKKNKGKKGRAAKTDDNTDALHVPFGMLSALLGLSIPPPLSGADLPRVVDNLKLKREYFVSNQDSATQVNINKADEKIRAQRAKREDVGPVE